MASDDRRNGVVATGSLLGGACEPPLMHPQLIEEITTCRAIARRCAFVIGPARSGTTILAQIINAHDRAFLTTEANYHLASAFPDFRAWYNDQHRMFRNQTAKSTYAPNFGYPGENDWWRWLARAADYFEVVGDKLASTEFHLQAFDPDMFMSFFESRFFSARYIFSFRDPVQTVLSSSFLWKKDPISLIVSWASAVKLWADFIRIFPFTLTVLLAELDATKIAEIGEFLGLDLTTSAVLFDHREQRVHQPLDSAGEFVGRIAPLLQMIYGEIKETVRMDRALLQSDQKRVRQVGGAIVPGNIYSDIAVVTTPVGRAWNLADQLVSDLQANLSRQALNSAAPV